ncbi:unnamed protein product [Arctia plantaginis]|uniref:Uncharacterized protein n=1 Tax=Arctia plantaginis TaxID=874455 RepID=A0A8S1A3T9_ARCPL|nr:unnamed protein product [Arctia plantaginis]
MEVTTSIKPKTLAELLPGLSGILTKDSIQTLTAKKQPLQRIVVTGTAEKVVKPLTVAEMRADISSLRVRSPRTFAQVGASAKKKTWNSTVKVDRTLSRTANGQLKSNPVKKALNFQSKPHPIIHSRATMAPELPKFNKPELRAKKKLFTQGNTRISGVTTISATPAENKLYKSRKTIANKENVPKEIKNKTLPPKIVLSNKLSPALPDTPMSNESWKSSCDASFLQNEKEINEVEEKTKALVEERTLANIAEVTPPVSTPFTHYRDIQDFFDHSHDKENSTECHDNTIMYFDNNLSNTQENRREESVIVSLCDLLNKATVNNTSEVNTELKDLLLIEKRTDENIKMIENSIAALNKIKVSQLVSLESVRKLIKEKQGSSNDLNQTLTPKAKQTLETKVKKEPTITILHQAKTKASSETSVIQTVAKSPTYKIPKKNLCLRKKVFYKSMPNVSTTEKTPPKTEMGHQALNMYLKMKEHMNFLSTPVSKQTVDIPNTPALTSHNLQKQLDKLYGEC